MTFSLDCHCKPCRVEGQLHQEIKLLNDKIARVEALAARWERVGGYSATLFCAVAGIRAALEPTS